MCFLDVRVIYFSMLMLKRGSFCNSLNLPNILQVHEFGSVAGSYASASEVPASMDAVSTMEEERFIAAAVKGLAGSKEGAALLCRHPQTLEGGLPGRARPVLRLPP